MSKVRKKKYGDDNVWEASLKRIHRCYDLFDNIIVNFSGGKDSTAVLNATLEVAKQRGKLPVKAMFFDEESLPPETIEYVERVRNTEGVDLDWICLPIKHRNACSNDEPYWKAWDEKYKDVWVREIPEYAITEHPLWEDGLSWQEFSDLMFPTSMGSVCTLTGVRTQESFRRYKAVTIKKNDNYILSHAINGNTYTAHPIYDWSSDDVWVATSKFGWDYNQTYDVMNKSDLYGKFLTQRVCAPFGEEPLRGLYIFAECWPELWHKMLKRVPVVATAWRYANTELYGYGKIGKPDELSYKSYLQVILESYEPESKVKVIDNCNSIIKRHYDKTDDKMPDQDPVHPLTGSSWEFLCKLAIKGDLKGRTGPTLESKAIARQKQLGISSYEEAKNIYGKRT